MILKIFSNERSLLGVLWDTLLLTLETCRGFLGRWWTLSRSSSVWQSGFWSNLCRCPAVSGNNIIFILSTSNQIKLRRKRNFMNLWHLMHKIFVCLISPHSGQSFLEISWFLIFIANARVKDAESFSSVIHLFVPSPCLLHRDSFEEQRPLQLFRAQFNLLFYC